MTAIVYFKNFGILFFGKFLHPVRPALPQAEVRMILWHSPFFKFSISANHQALIGANEWRFFGMAQVKKQEQVSLRGMESSRNLFS